MLNITWNIKTHILKMVHHVARLFLPETIKRFDNWVCLKLTILSDGARLYSTQELSKVFLNRSQVHLVKAKEEWSILMAPRFHHEIYERRKLIMRRRNIRLETYHIH